MNLAIQVLLILAFTGCNTSANSIDSDQSAPPPVPSQEQPEVLNQGPIHEGFAQPVDLNPQSGILAPNEPPPPVIENPSDEKPKSSNYVWIPGYWAWDADRKGYIWVSGCWRIPPANMSWVPGYWTKVSDGWQWVAGFWIPTSRAGQMEYLPKPPEVDDTEPAAASTTADNIWVPPCYYWVSDQYVLRAGYWLPPVDNWVWVPSCYTWTPYGYVFVPGYWDYVLATRGVLYAPIYFPPRYRYISGYSYPLNIIVDISNLDFCLFTYPRYCHYYFGDYYSDFYLGIGIYPWYECRTRHFWYDPIFTYNHWRYRNTIPHWTAHIEHEYSLRRADVNLRPPRTYRDLETRLARAPENQRRELRTVEPLRDNIEGRRNTVQMSRMSNNERQRIPNQSNRVNGYRQERSRIETRQPIQERGRVETRQPQERGQSSRQPGVSAPRTPESRQPSTGRIETTPRIESPRPSQPRGLSESQPRGLSERQPSSSRNFSERMTFPRSPVEGRSSGGLGNLFGGGGSSPRMPQSESRVGGGGGGRPQSGGGGGRTQNGGGESRSRR